MLELMYITNDPEIAKIADDAGVDRVWIDLETIGKEKRQKGIDSVKSKHTIADIKVIKPLLKNAKMQVRVNHMYAGSESEINAVIDAGADYVVLLFYKTVEEVKDFVKYVDGRATTILLLENKEAADIIDGTLQIQGVDEIHIGLNDLHLSLKQDFMFEPVANGMVEELCKKISAAGKPYGFGGIARIGEGLVPAEMVLSEHYRLGSTRAILSRSFCTPQKGQSLEEISRNFHKDLSDIRKYESLMSTREESVFIENHEAFEKTVSYVVKMLRKKKMAE